MADVRFHVIGISRDRRSEYLRACGEALLHRQQLKRAQLPEPPQPKLPGLMRHQAA